MGVGFGFVVFFGFFVGAATVGWAVAAGAGVGDDVTATGAGVAEGVADGPPDAQAATSMHDEHAEDD